MNDKIVIYHKNCADGFGAALAAWVKFGYSADYLAAHYGDTPPNVTGMDVFILDFSYPRDVLIEMSNTANSITLIDHHKSAMNDLAGMDKHLSTVIFDMDKSGAFLAWEYFHPTIPAPKLIQYIQDRDLWKWELKGSKEVSAALRIEAMDFENWERLLSNTEINRLYEKGVSILEYQNYQIKRIVTGDIPMQNIAGYYVPCLNINHLISEIGNELSKYYPFAAMYFETTNKRVYSLRSSENGVDVSEIAKRFGGGGHYHAAGFTITKPEVDLS